MFINEHIIDQQSIFFLKMAFVKQVFWCNHFQNGIMSISIYQILYSSVLISTKKHNSKMEIHCNKSSISNRVSTNEISRLPF